MAIYAPDVQELLPDLAPVVGRDAIARLLSDLMTQLPRFANHVEPAEITVSQSGDLAVVQGVYRFTPDTLDPTTVLSGKFIGVWRYQDDDWRLRYNISNAGPAA